MRLTGLPLDARLKYRSKVIESTGCIEWTGTLDTAGYGQITYHRKSILTHRAAWEIWNGHPIPKGMQVLHKCDNRPCMNPDHLFLGTNKDNVDDREAKGRNIIPRGEKHPLAKLTAEQIREIREDSRAQMEIARDYGVCQARVSAIKRFVAWSHVS